jgi:predicted secreted protein
MRTTTLHHRVSTLFLGSSFFLALFLVMPSQASAAGRASAYWRYSGSMSRTTSTYYRPNDEYRYRGGECYSYDRYGDCVDYSQYSDDRYYDDYDNRYYYDDYNDDRYYDNRYEDDYDDFYEDDYYYNNSRYNDRTYRSSSRDTTLRRSVLVGDTFGLLLPGNRDSAYRWKASFENGLSLKSRAYHGDWEHFNFKAMRRGTYTVTFTYGRSGSARLETIVYVVTVR